MGMGIMLALYELMPKRTKVYDIVRVPGLEMYCLTTEMLSNNKHDFFFTLKTRPI